MNKGFTFGETVEILKEHRVKPSKGLGQNFLTDKNILRKIVDGAGLTPGDEVLEIGPGIGTLTRELAARTSRVVSVEIDRRLIPVLEQTTSVFPNVRIINADALEMDLEELWRQNFLAGGVKVVANLPYYVASPIMMKLLEAEVPIHTIVIMVQKEVAQRMAASPGKKDYGALSVAVQFYSLPTVIAEVPPTVFLPPPKVSSAIIRLDVRQGGRYDVRDKGLMFSLVKAAFGQRRKTLANALAGALGPLDKEKIREVLEYCGIDSRRRGETLSVKEFCKLADCIYDMEIL